MASLRRNLMLPTLVLGLLVGGALAFVAWDAASTMRRLEHDVAQVRATNGLALALARVVESRQRLVVAYRYAYDPALLRELNRELAEEERLGAEVARLPLSPRGERLWAQYLEARAVGTTARDDLIAAVQAGEAGRVATAYRRWALSARNVRAILADFTGHSLRRLDVAIGDLEGRRDRSLAVLVVMFAATGLAVFGFRVYLGRRIVQPLVDVAETADRIAREKAAIPVGGGERDDEIGVLARAFNEMTGHLVQANAQLGDAIQARDEFLSIASHELKTPLTSLRLQLEIVGRKLSGRGETSLLDGARRQEQRLASLITELLDVTRIRAGRFALKCKPTDLSALVGGVLERFGPELERSGNQLAVHFSSGVTGEWDPERLDQVVTNLVSNAIKYAPGVRLHVRTQTADHGAIFAIRDEGPGLPDDVRARLFEPYHRASNEMGIGGLGLGLYIVKEIVQAHGGEVRVDATGHGTEFTVFLPATAPAR